jgi:phage-related protein
VSDTNVRVVFTGASGGAVRASEETAASLKRVGAAADKAADQLERLGRKAGDVRDIGTAGREAAQGVDEIRERAEAGTRAINEERRAMERLKVAGLLGGAATGAKWGLLAGGIASLGTVAVGATASLAPLAGSLAVLPGLATGAGLAFGTLKLALDNVGKALGGNKKALAALTPAGRQFVALLKSFTPLINQLRTSAQKGLFPGLADALNQLKNPAVFATLNKAIGEMGRSLGGVASQFAKVVSSQKFLSTFAVVAQAAAHWMQQFGTFAVKSFDAMISLTKAAIPLTNWMGNLAVKFATWLDNSIKAASASGKLQQFFQGVRESITLIGHALGQVGLALFDVLRIAKPFGDELFRALDRGATAVAKFAESAKGKAEIKAFFDSVTHAVKGLAPIAGALLQGIVRVLPHTLNLLGDLGRALGPALVPLIHLTVVALSGLIDVISRIANAIGPPIARAVGVVQQYLPGISDAARSVVSYFRANFLPPLISIFRSVGAVAVALVGVIRRNWPQISSIARSVGSVVQSALKIISAAASALAPIIRALGPLFKLEFTILAVQARFAAAVIKVAAAGIALALRAVEPVAQAMGAVVRGVIRAVITAWNGLKAAVSKVAKFLVDTGPLGAAIGVIHALMGAWNALRSAASHVIHFFTSTSNARGPGTASPGHLGPSAGRAAGGFIPGPPGAPVPILAHAGEVVLNRSQQAMLGGPRAIASMFGFTGDEGPGFATGGFVKPKPPKAPHIRKAKLRSPRHAARVSGNLAKKIMHGFDADELKAGDILHIFDEMDREFSISVDAYGNALDPGELDALIAERQKLVEVYQDEMAKLAKAIAAFKKAIKILVAAIKQEQEAINDDLQKIAAMERKRARSNKKNKWTKGDSYALSQLHKSLAGHKGRLSGLKSDLGDLQGGLATANMDIAHVTPFNLQDARIDIEELQQQKKDTIAAIAFAKSQGSDVTGGDTGAATDLGTGGGGGAGGGKSAELNQQLLAELGKLRLALALQNVQVPIIGQFQGGTLSVSETGLALVHAGERITPAGRPGGGDGGSAGDVVVNIHVDPAMAWLNGHIRAEAVAAAPMIARAHGQEANTRRRSGRY